MRVGSIIEGQIGSAENADPFASQTFDASVGGERVPNDNLLAEDMDRATRRCPHLVAQFRLEQLDQLRGFHAFRFRERAKQSGDGVHSAHNHSVVRGDREKRLRPSQGAQLCEQLLDLVVQFRSCRDNQRLPRSERDPPRHPTQFFPFRRLKMAGDTLGNFAELTGSQAVIARGEEVGERIHANLDMSE